MTLQEIRLLDLMTSQASKNQVKYLKRKMQWLNNTNEVEYLKAYNLGK